MSRKASTTCPPTGPENRQLRLIEGARPDWMLDSRTRRVGRCGVAQAREILRRAGPPAPFGPDSIAS